MKRQKGAPTAVPSDRRVCLFTVTRDMLQLNRCNAVSRGVLVPRSRLVRRVFIHFYLSRKITSPSSNERTILMNFCHRLDIVSFSCDFKD